MTAACARCGLAHPPDQACPARDEEVPLPGGTLLAGHYRILSVLGRGGMSIVYRATDGRFPERPVVIKELRVAPAADAEERRQAEAWLARECFVLSTLRHPLIPAFYAVFHEGGRSYLAEEYIDGESLEALVHRFGPLEDYVVVEWGKHLCDLLTALHEQPDGPLIYRDLKPSNAICRARDGKPVLIDFGITRPLRSGEVGTTIGTPGYAPPEQYQGLAGQESDVYALGATLHRLLTGYDPEAGPPFTFPPVRALNRLVSEELAAVVERAVQLDPAARYGSARQMKRALEAAPIFLPWPSGQIATAPSVSPGAAMALWIAVLVAVPCIVLGLMGCLNIIG